MPDVVVLPLRDARIAVTQAGYTLGEELDDLPMSCGQPCLRTAAAAGCGSGERHAYQFVREPASRYGQMSSSRARFPRPSLWTKPWRSWNSSGCSSAIAGRSCVRSCLPGRVLDQNPEPDTVVEPGTAMDFVYSQALPGHRVPEVVRSKPGGGEPTAVDLTDADAEEDRTGSRLGVRCCRTRPKPRRRRARIDIEVPPGRGQEVVILDYRRFRRTVKCIRQTVPGGTTVHEFVEGRGDGARLQVYVGGVMYMDELFPD